MSSPTQSRHRTPDPSLPWSSSPPAISPVPEDPIIESDAIDPQADLPTVRQYIDKLDASINTAVHHLSNPPRHQHYVQIPAKLADRDLDPQGGADTDNALMLQNALRYQGFGGLAEATVILGRTYQTDNEIKLKKNYDVITDPKNFEHFTMILYTMHHEFLTHLLRGDLAWEYCHNKNFYHIVKAHHSLRKRPGTYVQIIARTDSYLEVPDTQQTSTTTLNSRVRNQNAGAWLSPREIDKMYRIFEKYLPGPREDCNLAKEIDEVYQGGDSQSLTEYGRGYRRYVDDGNREKFVRMVKYWREVYIDRIEPRLNAERKVGDDTLLDIPLRACPFEIGYGVDVQARANAHDSHKSSNALFLFFLAVLNHTIDPQQQEFTTYRFQTNYLANVTEPFLFAQLADVGMTLIARSEWHQGGFNIVPGGGAGVNRRVIESSERWIEKNAELLYRNNSVVTANMERSRILGEKLGTFAQRVNNLPQDSKREKEALNQCSVDAEVLKTMSKNLKSAVMLAEWEDVVEQYKQEKARLEASQI